MLTPHDKQLFICIGLLSLCILSTDQQPGSFSNCLIIATTFVQIIKFKKLIQS